MTPGCVLALDLGTTAFKAAPVDDEGTVGPITVVPCRLDVDAGRVTCDPLRYARWALRALAGAAASACAAGLKPRDVGVSSQAQTFIGLDRAGHPLGPAIVWTDDRANQEASEIGALFPDYAASSGFLRPSPLQTLPKLLWMRRRHPKWRPDRVLLLNEWVIHGLTGRAFGDETLQGMCGLFDIRSRTWRGDALRLVGLEPAQMANPAPAGAASEPLTARVAELLGVSRIAVRSCGNDQSCAAVGAGIERPGEVLCNFGTAMIVYTVHDRPMKPATDAEIAGLHPNGDRWFLLGCEAEFGNVLEWVAKLLYPRRGVGALLDAGTAGAHDARGSGQVPVLSPQGGGRLAITHLSLGHDRADIARGVVETYAERFGALLRSVTRSIAPTRLAAAGGASRSSAWLARLSQEAGAPLTPLAWEHAGLAGIARIVREARH